MGAEQDGTPAGADQGSDAQDPCTGGRMRRRANMVLETKEDKILATGIANNMIKAAECARAALDFLWAAHDKMENVPLEVPDKTDKLADELIAEIETLTKKVAKAARDWSEESTQYEDAIMEYTKHNKTDRRM